MIHILSTNEFVYELELWGTVPSNNTTSSALAVTPVNELNTVWSPLNGLLVFNCANVWTTLLTTVLFVPLWVAVKYNLTCESANDACPAAGACFLAVTMYGIVALVGVLEVTVNKNTLRFAASCVWSCVSPPNFFPSVSLNGNAFWIRIPLELLSISLYVNSIVAVVKVFVVWPSLA